MTFDQFADEIDNLKDSFENRNLESYLLAIYKNIQDNYSVYVKEKPTLDLVLCILKEAFTSDPAALEPSWLEITMPPDPNRMSRKFTNPDIKDEFDKTNISDADGMDFTISVLKFQISELHKMQGKQLEDEYRYFGINSETGHRWYNFDPFTNLNCGVRCMDDNEDGTADIDWSFIGNLLEDGRIYE
ncbi:hypothetical protein JGH11_10355 [Dysgonomonas sp. Marseille-P4677]|uniref:hypothetical protein n=1 Tax=Dysgonomonas sp. Marseille-P4677 TaxID=2364790 RepID=UPI001914AA72|nr:hypothetical protein [Dysgonomonas sp. Marseille-P4677]MBK5721272.1 hypothetical protein [Dysgonomonas sp. Marseille-P4677]